MDYERVSENVLEKNQDDELKAAELSILKAILVIIEKHDLRYYMLGGTLLGAIRHQGFIPWDDDIDIGMPRPDYEAFLKYAERELQAPFKIQTALDGHSVYSYYYARIVDYRVMLRRTISETAVEIPVWIDIFPLDGVPEGKVKFTIWNGKCTFLYNLFKFSQFQYYYKASITRAGRFRKAKTVFKQAFYKLKLEEMLDTNKIWTQLDRELKKYPYENAEKIINFCGHWGLKEMFSREYYEESSLYKFEDCELRGPKNYDFILSQMYGDYMTPPPVSNRNQHSVEMISK